MNARRAVGHAAGVVLLAVLLTGCTEGSQLQQDAVASPAAGEPPVSECGSAFAAASSADPGPQRDEDVWATFDACADLEEFTTAAEVHPDVLEDDPEAFVTRTCQEEAAVAGSVLCAAVDG